MADYEYNSSIKDFNYDPLDAKACILERPSGQNHIIKAWETLDIDHMILGGPPGTGKTTLCRYLAKMSGRGIFVTEGVFDESHIFTLIAEEFEGLVVIDEAHKLSKKDQERLLPIIEEGRAYLHNDYIETDIRVALLTSEPDKLLDALKSRIGFQPLMRPYDDLTMKLIIEKGLAKLPGEPLTSDEMTSIVRAAAGVPRVGIKLGAQAKQLGCAEALYLMGYTPSGLSQQEAAILQAIVSLKGKGGVSNLKNLTGLSRDDYAAGEAGLVRKGCVEFKSTGRYATIAGIKAYQEMNKQ